MTLRIGIIGSGFGLYGLLPAFCALPNCRVVSFCGKQSPRLHRFIKRFSLEKMHLYQDWNEMLSCEPLDAIAIATPPMIQYKIAKIALEKKIHIFAEKPLTAQLVQANELLQIATNQKVTHGIDFLFPEIDVWQIAKTLLDKKKFGKPIHVAINWDFCSFDIRNKISSWKTDVSLGGGALSFYCAHVLHYLEYFVGPLVNLKSHFSYSPDSLNGGEVGIKLHLDFNGNTKGHARILCNHRDRMCHQLIFTCEHGQIKLENENSVTENFVLTTIDHQDKKMVTESLDFTPDKSPDNDERVLIVKRLAEKFVKACLRGESMTPSFVEGARVQKLIDLARVNQKI